MMTYNSTTSTTACRLPPPGGDRPGGFVRAQEATVPAPHRPSRRPRPASALERRTARFAPTDIGADLSRCRPPIGAVLAKLVEASKIIDALFLRQVWAGNEAMLLDLVRDEHAEGRARLHYFLINKGPWSRLDHNAAVRAGRAAEAGGRQLLPGGRDQGGDRALDGVAARTPSARGPPASSPSCAATPAGGLIARAVQPRVPERAGAASAALLREAAALAAEPTLKAFLTKRADAFLSNDYYDSDVAWMELKGAIEPTIGPYEVYEDEFFNYKAAFESFITVRDDAESAKLAEVRRRAAGHREPPADRSRSTATRSSARWRRSSSSTRSSRPATATAASRRRPSTCRTTSA